MPSLEDQEKKNGFRKILYKMKLRTKKIVNMYTKLNKHKFYYMIIMAQIDSDSKII